MTIKEIASMIDISAVRAESTWNEIEDILQATRKYPFICIFSMPSMLDRIFRIFLLSGEETDDKNRTFHSSTE